MSDAPHENDCELTIQDLEQVWGGSAFEIQRLMSDYVHALTSSWNAARHLNDTYSSVAGKI